MTYDNNGNLAVFNEYYLYNRNIAIFYRSFHFVGSFSTIIPTASQSYQCYFRLQHRLCKALLNKYLPVRNQYQTKTF